MTEINIDETIAIDEIDEKTKAMTIIVANAIAKIVIIFLNQNVL